MCIRDSLYTVLDISELTGELLPVGMFVALDYVWDKAKEDRTKAVSYTHLTVIRSKNKLQIIKNALNTVRLDPDHGELMYQILSLIHIFGQLRLHLPQPLHSSGLMTRRRLRPLQIGQ